MGRPRFVKLLLSIATVFWMLSSVPTPSAVDSQDNVAHASAGGGRTFVVGGVDFTNAVSTLSPFKYTSNQEKMVIWPCMSTLLTYDAEGKLIGDIVDSWTISDDGLTWHFKMQPNIYFTDPSNPSLKTHQLTWIDVQYTYFQTQNHSNNLQSFLKPYGSTQSTISRIWGSTATNWVNLTLNVPYAPFLNALTELPIIPKYYWQPHENVIGDATAWTGALPVGSGPWYYGLPGLPTTGEVSILKSPIWFQESNRGWQVHVNTLKYRTELSPDLAWTDLKLGAIDLAMDVQPSTYLNELPTTPSMTEWALDTGFVYEYNLCQMTNTMRSQLGTPYTSGSNNQLLLDPTIKKAMAMAVDKQGFVDTVLLGLGSTADSLVPAVNPWHHSPVNQVSFDIFGANALLQSNGYIDIDADGIREATPSSPAVIKGLVSVGSELNFRFCTLNTASEWAQGAILIRDWAAQIGVRLNLIVVGYGPMTQYWMKADYDTWLWDWLFLPSSDPSSDIMSLLTTDSIGSWGELYWSNETFDSVYNMSVVQMDTIARRTLTNQLQQLAYDNMGCQPVAYRKSLYAANISRWALSSFDGCRTSWTMSPDFCYPWLYARLSPVDNPTPVASLEYSSYLCLAGVEHAFSGSASDSSPLQYRWFWGDGTSTAWQSGPSATHLYSKGGYYRAYFAAQEVGTGDAFISFAGVLVMVTDPSNAPPQGLSFTTQPSRLEALQPVSFTGIATDPEDDPMSFSWDFGDGQTGAGRLAQHIYSVQGTYSVTMFVTDNEPGFGRPSVYSSTIFVGPVNSPPTISVPSQFFTWKVLTWFYATASDSDGDMLRFTWLWGDGTTSVTDSPSATHTYQQKLTYTLTVYADDLTGDPGHNVSDSGIITHGGGIPVQPTIVSFSASALVAKVGDAVSFTGVASDINGGILRLTFQYAGTPSQYDVITSDSLIAGEQYSATVTHSWAVPGTKSVTLYVMDNTGNNVTTTPILLTIVSSPGMIVVVPLSPYTGVVGQTLSFNGDAFDPYHPVLRYTWSFGDGSALKVGQNVSYAYAKPGTWTVTLYVDDFSGLPGHNVSVSTIATIGWRLNLVVGWNLISLPMLTSCTADSLGLSTGDEIVSWNSATQTYDKIFIEGVTPPSMDFALAPSYGYWVYVSTAKTLTLYGTVPTTTQSRAITVPAAGGWVLIGFCSMNTGWRAANLASMYAGSTVSTVVAWNAATDFYTTHVIGLPINNFSLIPGAGYWIFVNGSGMLTYNP